MLKILVTDDHAILRRGLRQVLEQEFAPAKVAEAESGNVAIEAVRKDHWDIVVLDINLSDKNGIDVLKEIKVLSPTLPVVMLTLYPEEQYAIRALKAGAAGYLTKDSEPEELVLAMRKALSGGIYVSSDFGEKLASSLIDDKGIVPYQALSDRELEVLRLIGQGKSLTQISDLLSLSVKTIGTYQTRIKEKLNLDTTASLIRFALENKLVN